MQCGAVTRAIPGRHHAEAALPLRGYTCVAEADDTCDSPSEENVSISEIDSASSEAAGSGVLEATDCREALRSAAPSLITAAVYQRLQAVWDDAAPLEQGEAASTPAPPAHTGTEVVPRAASEDPPQWMRLAAAMGHRGMVSGATRVEEYDTPCMRVFTQRARPVYPAQERQRPTGTLYPWDDVAVARKVQFTEGNTWLQLLALDPDARDVHGGWLPYDEGVEVTCACFYDRGFEAEIRPKFEAEGAVAPVHAYYSLSKREAELVIPKHARNKRVKGKEVHVVVLSSRQTALKDHMWSERPESVSALQGQGLYVVPHQQHADALRVFHHKTSQCTRQAPRPSEGHTVPQQLQDRLKQQGIADPVHAFYRMTRREANGVVAGRKWSEQLEGHVTFVVVDGWVHCSMLPACGAAEAEEDELCLLSSFDADADRLHRRTEIGVLKDVACVADTSAIENDTSEARAVLANRLLPRMKHLAEVDEAVASAVDAAEAACMLFDAVPRDLPAVCPHGGEWSCSACEAIRPQCFAADTLIPKEDIAEDSDPIALPYDGDMVLRVRNAPTRNGRCIAKLTPGMRYMRLKGTFSTGSEKWAPVCVGDGTVGFARITPSATVPSRLESYLVDEGPAHSVPDVQHDTRCIVDAAAPVADPCLSCCAMAVRCTPVFHDSAASVPQGVMLEPHAPAVLLNEDPHHDTVQVRLTQRRGVQWDFDEGWVRKADVAVGPLPFLDSRISDWLAVQKRNGFVLPTYSCFNKAGLQQCTVSGDVPTRDRTKREEELAKLEYVVSFAPSTVQTPKESGCSYRFSSQAMSGPFTVANVRSLHASHLISYDAYTKSWFRSLRANHVCTSGGHSVHKAQSDSAALHCQWVADAVRRLCQLEGGSATSPLAAAMEKAQRVARRIAAEPPAARPVKEDSEWAKGSFCLHSPPHQLECDKLTWRSVRYVGPTRLVLRAGPSLAAARVADLMPGARMLVSDIRCNSAKGTEVYAYAMGLSGATAPDALCTLSTHPIGWIVVYYEGVDTRAPSPAPGLAAMALSPAHDDNQAAVACQVVSDLLPTDVIPDPRTVVAP